MTNGEVKRTVLAKTLNHAVEFTGVGLHSGTTAKVKLCPADEGGIRFCRTDLPGRPCVSVRDVNTDAAPYRTVLKNGGTEIHTVEHLLSAVAALGVTDCLVEIDAVEVPGMDGSAAVFASEIQRAGIRVIAGRQVEVLDLQHEIAISDGIASIRALPNPTGGLHISYTLDYPGQPLAQGRFEIDVTADSFAREISPARTFAIRKDAEAMRAAGLGLGANTQNTVVIDGTQVFETTMRFPNEPVRHKILDLIGDLTPVGRPLCARIEASCSGHKSNRLLALKLREQIA